MGVPPWAISPPSLMTPRCNTERQLPRCASQRSLQWARLEIPSDVAACLQPIPYTGNAGHAAERGPDRDRPDPTRTDAKTQSNSIYLAQVPQNSRMLELFQQQEARKEHFWFHSVVTLSSMLAISRFAKQWFGSFQQHRERKAKNCSKSFFSGLRTELHKQPINTKSACQILPQPRKAHNCSKSSFLGLWTEFQKQPINTKCACQILPQPRKAHNCFKSSFSGLWTEFHQQPINTVRLWQILPQPPKAKNCSKSSFSGLWTDF